MVSSLIQIFFLKRRTDRRQRQTSASMLTKFSTRRRQTVASMFLIERRTPKPAAPDSREFVANGILSGAPGQTPVPNRPGRQPRFHPYATAYESENEDRCERYGDVLLTCCVIISVIISLALALVLR